MKLRRLLAAFVAGLALLILPGGTAKAWHFCHRGVCYGHDPNLGGCAIHKGNPECSLSERKGRSLDSNQQRISVTPIRPQNDPPELPGPKQPVVIR